MTDKKTQILSHRLSVCLSSLSYGETDTDENESEKRARVPED